MILMSMSSGEKDLMGSTSPMRILIPVGAEYVYGASTVIHPPGSSRILTMCPDWRISNRGIFLPFLASGGSEPSFPPNTTTPSLRSSAFTMSKILRSGFPSRTGHCQADWWSTRVRPPCSHSSQSWAEVFHCASRYFSFSSGETSTKWSHP